MKKVDLSQHAYAMSLLEDLQNLTEAEARDLGHTDRAALRALFMSKGVGLFLFAKHIFGYEDLTTDLHLPISQFLSRWGETEFQDGHISTSPVNELSEDEHGEIIDSYRRLMVCIPRECFKTSLGTRALALWTICRSPDHNATVVIFNEKAENTQAWISSIAQVVERNHLFQVLWQEMIPKGIGFWDKDKGVTRGRSHKWGGSGLLFERGAWGIPELSIEGHGIGGATTGKHWTHKILDDIIGRNAAYSQAEMQNAIDWLDNSRPLERPAEGGCELFNHTPWAYHDVYSHALKKWPGEYKVLKRHILEDKDGRPDAVNGKSIFRTKISTAKAKKLLKTDPFVNWAQYMCIPKAGRSQSFADEWFRSFRIMDRGPNSSPFIRILDEFFDPEICDPDSNYDHAPQLVPLHYLEKAVILDPAPSKPTDIKAEPKAGNGICVVGRDPWNRRYCLESFSVHDGPTEVLDLLMQLCYKWNCLTIGIEEVNFSAIYAPLYEALIRYKYADAEFQPDFVPCYTKGRQKHVRIKQLLIPPMENGFWYFNVEGTATLRQELVEFPNGERIDEGDALSYTDEIVSRPETIEQQELHQQYLRNYDEELGVTGYGAFHREHT